MENSDFYDEEFDDDAIDMDLEMEGDEEEIEFEYNWADFGSWYQMQKTDRWDTRNYYPTEWELFLKEKDNYQKG